MTTITNQTDLARVAFVAPTAGVLGLNVPANAAPRTGSLVAGTNWRQAGELCPPPALRGSAPTYVQGMKIRTVDVRPIAAFASKHVPGLPAWSPPI